MGKIKGLIASVCIIVILVLIPATVIGTIISNPIGFIGEMIFDDGDTTSVSKEIKEMYSNFISSELGKECIDYIENLNKEDDQPYSYKFYVIPCLLVIDTNIEEPTMKEIGLDQLLKKAFEIRSKAKTDDEYITMLKQTKEFNKLNSLSHTTILMYINQLGGSSTTNGTLPMSTDDLKVIAQGDLYIGTDNPFVASGYRGQCTWWCWSRVKEVTGVIMPTSNARDWVKDTSLPKGKKPKTHAVLALWDKGTNDLRQHVIFIEDYSDGYITFSEGNIGGDGTVEYTREHYLELLRYGKMKESEFFRSRILQYDHYEYIYTE